MGNVTVAVSLLSGILDRDLIVSLRTLDGTAVGKSDNKLSQGTCIVIVCSHLGKVTLSNLISQSSWNGL